MIFVTILFLSALALSAVAAFYSIAGLLTLFPAAGSSIIIMGVTLEIAKLVAASWAYRNWQAAPKVLKYYFTSAVIVLSFITSMGIFGYLSKAHIDHKYSFSDSSIIVSNSEREIKSEEQLIVTAQRSIDILDKLVSDSDSKDANWVRSRQKKEREQLNTTIRTASDRIRELNIELAPLRQESARIEAEIGPIKYVADFIYGQSDEKVIEKAVRWVIVIIVLVFDPLAIILLVAANREQKIRTRIYKAVRTRKTNKQESLTKKNKNTVELDKSQIAEIPKEIMEKVFNKKKSR